MEHVAPVLGGRHARRAGPPAGPAGRARRAHRLARPRPARPPCSAASARPGWRWTSRRDGTALLVLARGRCRGAGRRPTWPAPGWARPSWVGGRVGGRGDRRRPLPSVAETDLDVSLPVALAAGCRGGRRGPARACCSPTGRPVPHPLLPAALPRARRPRRLPARPGPGRLVGRTSLRDIGASVTAEGYPIRHIGPSDALGCGCADRGSECSRAGYAPRGSDHAIARRAAGVRLRRGIGGGTAGLRLHGRSARRARDAGRRDRGRAVAAALRPRLGRAGRRRRRRRERAAEADLGGPLGERATLVQFSSAFCQPCRATRRVLDEVSRTVPGVAHVEVDAESNLELVRRLDVRRTPTVLVLDAARRHRPPGQRPAPQGRRHRGARGGRRDE